MKASMSVKTAGIATALLALVSSLGASRTASAFACYFHSWTAESIAVEGVGSQARMIDGENGGETRFTELKVSSAEGVIFAKLPGGGSLRIQARLRGQGRPVTAYGELRRPSGRLIGMNCDDPTEFIRENERHNQRERERPQASRTAAALGRLIEDWPADCCVGSCWTTGCCTFDKHCS